MGVSLLLQAINQDLEGLYAAARKQKGNAGGSNGTPCTPHGPSEKENKASEARGKPVSAVAQKSPSKVVSRTDAVKKAGNFYVSSAC